MYFTDEWAAERSGKHRTTVARWRALRCWPPELLRLAALELDGELGLIHLDWNGWKLDRRNGEIYAPTARYGFRPGQLLTIPLRAEIESALRRQLSTFRSTATRPNEARERRACGRRLRFAQGKTVCPHCGLGDRRQGERQAVNRLFSGA